MAILKVISGGQTGADQAGLFAAKELGIVTGGWMPKGFRTEKGSWDQEQVKNFGMQENFSSDYTGRTLRNIKESDFTLIFGNLGSPGSRLTYQICQRYNKNVYIENWVPGMKVPEIKQFVRLIRGSEIRVLNIAGNRESKAPGIFWICKAFLLRALKEINDDRVP